MCTDPRKDLVLRAVEARRRVGRKPSLEQRRGFLLRTRRGERMVMMRMHLGEIGRKGRERRGEKLGKRRKPR